MLDTFRLVDRRQAPFRARNVETWRHFCRRYGHACLAALHIHGGHKSQGLVEAMILDVVRVEDRAT